MFAGMTSTQDILVTIEHHDGDEVKFWCSGVHGLVLILHREPGYASPPRVAQPCPGMHTAMTNRRRLGLKRHGQN